MSQDIIESRFLFGKPRKELELLFGGDLRLTDGPMDRLANRGSHAEDTSGASSKVGFNIMVV